eukprot:Gb_41575 [translate_table: standard]
MARRTNIMKPDQQLHHFNFMSIHHFPCHALITSLPSAATGLQIINNKTIKLTSTVEAMRFYGASCGRKKQSYEPPGSYVHHGDKFQISGKMPSIESQRTPIKIYKC